MAHKPKKQSLNENAAKVKKAPPSPVVANHETNHSTWVANVVQQAENTAEKRRAMKGMDTEDGSK